MITAALAYTTGIAASRRLGSRLASFVALLEVVAAVGFAWLLLHQLPGPLQLVGGVFVLAGVVVVKLGELPPRRTPLTRDPCALAGLRSRPARASDRAERQHDPKGRTASAERHDQQRGGTSRRVLGLDEEGKRERWVPTRLACAR